MNWRVLLLYFGICLWIGALILFCLRYYFKIQVPIDNNALSIISMIIGSIAILSAKERR